MKFRRGRRFRTAVLLITLLSLAMAGCGKKSQPVRLADTVSQIQGLEEYSPSGALAEAFADDVVYVVTDLSWSGDVGTATVTITTPDLAEIIADSVDRAIDQCGTADYEALLNKVKAYIQETLSSDRCPMMDSVVVMRARKNPEGYSLISNKEFERIIGGNLERIFALVLTEEMDE